MDLERGGAKSQDYRFEAKSFLTAPAAGFAFSMFTYSFLSFLFFLTGGGLFEPGTFFFVRRARTYFYLPGPRGISARSYLILAGIPGRIFFPPPAANVRLAMLLRSIRFPNAAHLPAPFCGYIVGFYAIFNNGLICISNRVCAKNPMPRCFSTMNSSYKIF